MFEELAKKLEDNKEEALKYLSSDLLLSSITDAKTRDFSMGLAGYGPIEPIYTPSYSDFKRQLSSYRLNGKTPDLFVSGSYYDSLNTRVLSIGVYETYSDNSRDYFKGLTQKYGGEELYDLSNKEFKAIAEDVESALLEILKL